MSNLQLLKPLVYRNLIFIRAFFMMLLLAETPQLKNSVQTEKQKKTNKTNQNKTKNKIRQ